MGIFRDIQRMAANIYAKRQTSKYKKLRRDTKLTRLQKAKLERMQQAEQEKAKAVSELKALKPQRKKLRWMPNLSGLQKLTKGMPSDAELNRAVLGSTSSKTSIDTTQAPNDSDLDNLSKDIFK